MRLCSELSSEGKIEWNYSPNGGLTMRPNPRLAKHQIFGHTLRQLYDRQAGNSDIINLRQAIPQIQFRGAGSILWIDYLMQRPLSAAAE